MPESMRSDYSQKLLSYIPSARQILLITMQYVQAKMEGPPFSVAESEVRQLYENDFHVDVLAEIDILQHQPRFKQRGLHSLMENVFLLDRC